MTSPDPYNFPQAWDTIQINNVLWGGPFGLGGKIKIIGATRFYKVDQKDGQGLDGATQTFRGVKPKPFKLEFSWWTAEQHAQWAFMSNQFIFTASKANGPPPVFDVSHPALSLLGISAILVDEVGAVDVDENTKLSKAIVTVRQFYPPPPTSASTTPLAAPPIPPPTPPPTPTGVVPITSEQVLLQAQIAVTRSIANAGVPAAFPAPP
jgi:hypothetical protein